MRTIWFASIALLILFAATPIAIGQTHVKHDGFDQILKNYVKEGHFTYADIRDHAKFDLYAYLDYMANVDVRLMSRDEQLAYYLNLYNASVMRGIVERWQSGYSPAEQDQKLFKDPVVNLSEGRRMSLNDLRDKIIRPTFKDPRVHVALVSGTRGNLPLMNRAYQADDLNGTLDARMKRFINDPAYNKIDRQNKKLVLSKIFDWFADDFGGRNALPAYISKYAEGGSVEGFAVEFADFDWSVNS
jgi:hypothetical protein